MNSVRNKIKKPLMAWLPLTLGLCAACGVSTYERLRPVADVAASQEAQLAFSKIMREWSASEEGRAQRCMPGLQDFLTRFPQDNLALIARTYLAVTYIELGQNERAESLLAMYEKESKRGHFFDFYQIVKAKLLRSQHKEKEAYTLLKPLKGKLVDKYALKLFYQEFAYAALFSGAFVDAIKAMDIWLLDVEGQAQENEISTLKQMLIDVPDDVVESTYTDLGRADAKLKLSFELKKLLAQRLAQRAIERENSRLARLVLDPVFGSQMFTEAEKEDLSYLAHSRRGLVSAVGRTIGFIVHSTVASFREEAADVLTGLSFSLGIPRQTKGKESFEIDILTHDMGSLTQIEPELEALRQAGVVAIVAGYEVASADAIIRWAKENAVPCLLLVPGKQTAVSEYGFVVGESVEAQLQSLTREMKSQNIVEAAFVTDAVEKTREVQADTVEAVAISAPISCDSKSGEAGAPDFPLGIAEDKNVHTWINAGPDTCVERLARDLVRYTKFRPPMAKRPLLLSTLSGGLSRESRSRLVQLSLGAGFIPVQNADEMGDPSLQNFSDLHGTTPNYWSALGHDIGALLKPVLAELPTTLASNEGELRRRRAHVDRKLSQVEASLWTSEKKGFEGSRKLPRTLGLVHLR